jgi:hypothetical protein
VGWRRDRTVAHWALERGHSFPRGTALVSPAPTGHLLGTTSRRGGRDFCFSTKAALCVAGTTVTAHPAGGRTRSLGPPSDPRDNPCRKARRSGRRAGVGGVPRYWLGTRGAARGVRGRRRADAQLHGGCCTNGRNGPVREGGGRNGRELRPEWAAVPLAWAFEASIHGGVPRPIDAPEFRVVCATATMEGRSWAARCSSFTCAGE